MLARERRHSQCDFLKDMSACKSPSRDDDDDIYEGDLLDYYNYYEPDEIGNAEPSIDMPVDDNEDPERFECECLEKEEVEGLLNELVQELTKRIPVTPALAKVLLHNHRWDVEALVRRYREDCHGLLVATHLKPPRPVPTAPRPSFCPVCVRSLPCADFLGLACGHHFCLQCWTCHCEAQLNLLVSTGLECMDSRCRLLAPEDFLRNLLSKRSDLGAKYEQLVFQDYVKSHPELRHCPGADCPIVIRAKEPEPKKVECKRCRLSFCFICGMDYHAPTDCETIKKWLMKCADDSETANYITANTKDCPSCHACIEKNGGCNHMQCTKCKHHFCWMCLGDWKQHGSEYYECSRYKENPGIANETVHVKARAALEKYLFYFERWENHNKSLKLEEQLFGKIQQRVADKTTQKEGTWIDWQFLYAAAELLTKARYTLQYTYPFAYYMDSERKPLFEYQQAQLEKEIEELAWKVERAETTDRGDMERQMNSAEKKRKTLLAHFFESRKEAKNASKF